MKATAPLLPTLVAFAFACSHGAADAPKPEPEPAAAAPAAAPTQGDYASQAAAYRVAAPATNDVFVLEPSSLSLGLLDPNEEKRVDFLVKNLSALPLKIIAVKTGCKCITLDYSKGAIASGATSPVHVRVVGVTRESRRVTVTVTTDDPRRSSAELAIFYSVVPDVGCLPPKLDFGKVKTGEKAELAIKVTLHLPPELEKVPELAPFIQHDLPIKITLDPPTLTPGSGNNRDLTTTLHAVLDTSKVLPSFQTQLVFKPKEAKSFRLTSIPVFGEVRAGTFFEHDKLVYTGVSVGAPVTKPLRLYYSGDQAPPLAEVAVTPAEFTEKHEVEAASHCIRFDVTCTPSAPGSLNGELSVRLGAADAPLTVALTARGK